MTTTVNCLRSRWSGWLLASFGLCLGALLLAQSPAGAQEGSLTASVSVSVDNTLGGSATAADFTLEIYDETGALVSSGPSTLSVSLPGPGTYTLGQTGPEGYHVTLVTCSSNSRDEEPIDRPDATFTIGDVGASQYSISCTVWLTHEGSLSATVTKVVQNAHGGTATAGDFTMEIFDADGAVVASGSSPLTAELPGPGDYTIGETGPDGYVATAVTCSERLIRNEEPIGLGSATFTAPEPRLDGDWIIDCLVDNAELDPVGVTVTKLIDSANGAPATATAGDFTMEIFDADGAVVASGSSPLSVELPGPGDYTIGETGPDGYVATAVSCEEEPVASSEPIDLASATFTAPARAIGIPWELICVVENTAVWPVEVTVTAIVENPFGGNAVPSDFTVELFDADGVIVTSSPGRLEASLLDGGDHTLGAAGPDGYVASEIICGPVDGHGEPIDLPSAIVTVPDASPDMTAIACTIRFVELAEPLPPPAEEPSVEEPTPPPGRICGTVTIGDRPAGGVELFVESSNGVISTVTAADGSYCFDETFAPAAYTVSVNADTDVDAVSVEVLSGRVVTADFALPVRQLAFTGAGSVWLIVMASSMLMAGLGMVAIGRRLGRSN